MMQAQGFKQLIELFLKVKENKTLKGKVES